MRRILFFLFCALAAGASGSDRFFFDGIGADSGLPPSSILALAQTRDGYLWVGTEGGLARFDGVQFEVFRHANAPALASNTIHCLYEDRGGDLWIGTQSGVARLRQGHFEAVTLAGRSVWSIAQDREGRMWFAVPGVGVFSWDQGRLTSYEREPAMLDPAPVRILVDSRDRLWIGFDRAFGLVCGEMSGGVRRFRRYDGGGQIAGEVQAMCEQPRGTLWFGTRTNGLYRLGPDGALGHLDPQRDANNVRRETVTDLEPAQGGGIWVAAGNLEKIADPKKLAIDSIPGCPSENIHQLWEDREGSVWLGAVDAGLIRMQRVPFPFIGSEEGLPGSSVKTVTEDPSGNIWLAVQRRGIARVAPDGTVALFGNHHGFPGNNPGLVYASRDGRLWVGVINETVVWDKGQSRALPGIPLLRGAYEDRSGAVWLGTEPGLYVVRGQRVERYDVPPRPPIPYATSFSEGPDGTLYVGTWRSGVFALKDGQVAKLDRSRGLPVDDVRAIYADASGCVWVGLSSRGLVVLQDGRFYGTDALTDAVAAHVSAIEEDDRGNLWLGTPAGVLWAPRSDLLAAARGERPAPRLHRVGTIDGSHTASVYSGAQPAVWKTRDHRLLFATRWGILAVDPDHLPANDVPPPVSIRRVTVDQQAVDWGAGPVRIPAGAKEIAIAYTALSFIQPRQIGFSYKLEGYDRDWVDAGSQRIATYTHLPSRRYVFRVRAQNAAGIWNEAGASLALVQLPHFYETWWFMVLAAAAAAASAWGLNRWSHRRLRLKLERLEARQAMEKERRRIAKNLHDELGANLTEIGLFAERARRRAQAPAVQEDLNFLSERVRGLTESLDAVVWTVNPANDSLDRAVSYLCGLSQDLFRLSPIRCRLDVPPEIPALPLNPEQRTHLFLAAKEAMNNVLKHSRAKEAWLRIRAEEGRFSLAIEDDGRGFDPDEAERGGRNGLSNLRWRMNEMRGECRITSSPGAGCRVLLSFLLLPCP